VFSSGRNVGLGVKAVAAAALLAVTAGCQQLALRSRVDPRTAVAEAMKTLREATEDPDWATRAEALEALAETLGREGGPIYVRALKDKQAGVRFAAAMAIGDTRYVPAKKLLAELAEVGERGEKDKRVYTAIIYALYRLGDDSKVKDLGPLLFDKEEEVRANAAMVMGKMGEPKAIDALRYLLSEQASRQPLVRLNALEALARLGDRRSIGILESYTRWPVLDFQLVAIRFLGELRGDPQSLGLLRLLLKSRQPRVRVTAAGALAARSDVSERDYEYCVRAARTPEAVLRRAGMPAEQINEASISSLQGLAARALGRMRRRQAVNVLYPLLNNSYGNVRVAAAMSILQLLPDVQLPAESEAS